MWDADMAIYMNIYIQPAAAIFLVVLTIIKPAPLPFPFGGPEVHRPEGLTFPQEQSNRQVVVPCDTDI